MYSPVRNLRMLSPAPLDADLQEFLLDRAARGLSPPTIAWYREKLEPWRAHLQVVGVTNLANVESSHIRAYLVALRTAGHNPGGIHGHYRALRALLRWYGDEYASPGRDNPIARVRAPHVADEPLAPVPLDDLRQMLATCTRRSLADDRDRALLLFLLDTGCRRAEVLALNLGDVDLGSGSVAVRHGKGGKSRMTFLGTKARKALAGYLRYRRGAGLAEPLWITTTQGSVRLSYHSLREIVRRRAKAAGVPAPGLHAFRRAFALNALRAGIDLVNLQRLMGHTTLDILQRYLAQTDADLQRGSRWGLACGSAAVVSTGVLKGGRTPRSCIGSTRRWFGAQSQTDPGRIENALHRAFSVLCFNGQGYVRLHEETQEKHHGGVLTNSAL